MYIHRHPNHYNTPAIGSSSFAVLAGGDNVLTFMLTLITSVMAMIIHLYE